MQRMTRRQDEYPCRINHCTAEEWIEDVIDMSIYWYEDCCEGCPFMAYINKLAEYEDLEEKLEDDLK